MQGTNTHTLHKNSHRDTHSQVRFHVYTLSTQRDSDSTQLWALEHTHWDLSVIEKLQPWKGQTAQDCTVTPRPQQRPPQVTVETASPGELRMLRPELVPASGCLSPLPVLWMHQSARGGAPGKGVHLLHFLVFITYQVPEVNDCPGQVLGTKAPEGLQMNIGAPSSPSECSSSFLDTGLAVSARAPAL